MLYYTEMVRIADSILFLKLSVTITSHDSSGAKSPQLQMRVHACCPLLVRSNQLAVPPGEAKSGVNREPHGNPH